MKHTYKVTGMTCAGCQVKVKKILSTVEGVTQVNINDFEHVTVDMNSHIDASQLNKALESNSKYRVYENEVPDNSFWNDTFTWKRAAKNTLSCLIGCSIGDFGVIIYFQSNHIHINMYLMMMIAMISGLTTSIILETVVLKINEKFDWITALKTAFGMSFLSMVTMEITENATDLLLTGGQVDPSQPFYWMAIAISLIMGFIAPLPYNYYQLKKHGISCH
ncbi:MAG: DUF4396 domain-containing protein [Bacteroidota bacterium]|nr:DUF4396 domain-containing protein [Bacteroidota bacterium]